MVGIGGSPHGVLLSRPSLQAESKALQVRRNAVAHGAAHEGRRPPDETPRCAGAVNGDQSSRGAVLEFVTHTRWEWAINLELDHLVGFVGGHAVPIGEFPPEKPCVALDG